MSRTDDKIVFRSPSRSELKFVHKLVLDEGWYGTLAHFEVGYDLNPHRWIIAQNRQGEIVGVCAGTVINADISLMGPYTVDCRYRGRGVGTLMWKEIQANLDKRNIYVLATIPHVYKMIGFKECSYDVSIMSGIPCLDSLSSLAADGMKIVRANNVPIDQLIEYDTSVNCGIPRPQYVQEWILHREATTLIAYQKDKSGNKVVGFGAIRPCNGGWQLAPLYADDRFVAENLWVKLVREFPRDTKVVMYILTANVHSLDMAHTIGLTPCGHFKPMCLTEEIKLPFTRIYTMSTVCFGIV